MVRFLHKLAIYATLTAALAIVAVPLVQLVSVSLQSASAIDPLSWPLQPQWSNFSDAIERGNLLRYFQNSITVLLLTASLTLAVAILAAYGLHHGNRRWSDWLFVFFLLGLILPSYAGAIPSFLLLRELSLLNTRIGLSLIQVAAGLSLPLFLYVQFFKTIPVEIEEAALVDGCSVPRLFVQVMVPLTQPVSATCLIIVALASWNDFFNPLVYMSSPDMRTLPVGLMAFKGQFSAQWPQLFAAAAMIAAPVAVLYLFLQKFIIKGLVGSAVKG